MRKFCVDEDENWVLVMYRSHVESLAHRQTELLVVSLQ
jgi:hypothetical protein